MDNKCSCENEKIPVVSTELTLKDAFGAVKARLGIGRMDYAVAPGLYAVGKPDGNAPVLVSANYKLTFDTLRRNLTGIDCWLLILDTKGINVWCAAGKGMFGTEELVRRIKLSGLTKYVSHKRLVLPQLGATGVSAHEVERQSGYDVVYGPVRAADIKEYIAAGYKATREMRTVNFTLWDRIVLTPMELFPAFKRALPVLGALFVTNQFSANPFDKHDVAAYAGSVVAGAVLTPALLPYLPGKAFSFKGMLAGLGWTAAYLLAAGRFKKGRRLIAAGELLLLPAISSYLALNYTGASTYASPSGVQKEMKRALPFIVGAAAAGGALLLGAHFFGGRRKKHDA